MIDFTCNGCGKAYRLPDDLAGRKATCKACGAALVVPMVAVSLHAGASSVGPKLPVRVRRLMADAAQMAAAFSASTVVRVTSTVGNPPETYRIDYSVNGLERGNGGGPVPRDRHTVEIQLTGEYPRVAPKCRMLTPVFHPNIDPATICVGDHWTAGERLVDLVIRIGEMLAYQSYNIRSPLDAEAAMWADLHPERLPIDARVLRA